MKRTDPEDRKPPDSPLVLRMRLLCSIAQKQGAFRMCAMMLRKRAKTAKKSPKEKKLWYAVYKLQGELEAGYRLLSADFEEKKSNEPID